MTEAKEGTPDSIKKRFKPLESMNLGDLVGEAIGLKIAIEDLGGYAPETADTYMDRYLAIIKYLNEKEQVYKTKVPGM